MVRAGVALDDGGRADRGDEGRRATRRATATAARRRSPRPELYKARAGLQAVGIPYRTSMASLPEMFSGELDFQFIDATAGHAAAASPASCAGSRSPPASACRASTCRPWRRPPTFPNSTSRRSGACSCRPARRRRSSRGWKPGSPRSCKMDATRAFLANTHGAPFPGGAKDAGRIPAEGNQEVGGAGEAREDRAAVGRAAALAPPQPAEDEDVMRDAPYFFNPSRMLVSI